MLLLTHRSTSKEVASKPTRNGYVHPMIPFIIATSLTCSEAHDLVDKMRSYRVEDETKAEMISIVEEETEGCWDANAD